MTFLLSICGLLGALAIGAISPGPSFVFIVRTSVAGSRREGLAAAIGMGFGGVVFATLAIGGLQALLTQVSWLFLVFKTAGALYLFYLATCLWRGAHKPIEAGVGAAPMPGKTRSALARGFLVQVGNPKTVIVYGSIFAALLPRNLPQSVTFVLPILVFVVECGWYSVVAVALSSESTRKIYLQFKAPIDRLAGGILGLLGLKLLFAAEPKP